MTNETEVQKLMDRVLRLERAITELRQGGQYNLAGAMPDWHLHPTCDKIATETLERFDPRVSAGSP